MCLAATQKAAFFYENYYNTIKGVVTFLKNKIINFICSIIEYGKEITREGIF